MPITSYVRLACSRTRTAMMARFVRAETGTWDLTGASPHGSVAQFQAEHVAHEVTGPFGISPEYPGCPQCRADSYVKCGVCARLSCWQSGTLSTCGWCGNTAPVSGQIESLQRVD